MRWGGLGAAGLHFIRQVIKAARSLSLQTPVPGRVLRALPTQCHPSRCIPQLHALAKKMEFLVNLIQTLNALGFFHVGLASRPGILEG